MRLHKRPEFRILIFIGIMAFLVITGTIAILLIAISSLTGAATQSDSALPGNIKIGTFAVCEQKDSSTFCEDRVFASCNRVPIEVKNGVFECNDSTYDIGDSTLGNAYMQEGWADPRPSNAITAWAASE